MSGEVGPGRKPLILVADDDLASRILVRTALEQSDFEVVEAENGAQAVALAAKREPHLVLMDVVMPEMDGFEACAALRRLPNGAGVPVLMLTGLDDVESINRAYEVGATDFVTKPMNWVILSHRVRYMLRASSAAADLRKSEQSLAAAQRIAQLGNWEQDLETGELRWSAEVYRLLGVDPESFQPTFERFMDRVHPEDRPAVLRAAEDILKMEEPLSLELRVVRPDGAVRDIHEVVELLRDAEGGPKRLVGTTQDITERKKTEEQIRFLAYYDGLTRLPNRQLFIERLRQAIVGAARRERTVAVLFLDLDRFKRVNDTLGHGAGDLLLRGVAERLRGCLRATDTVSRPETESGENLARLGGDEFIVLVSDMVRGEDAAKVARRILDVLREPFDLDSHEVYVTASIGISLHPGDGEDVETLLKNADTAMYHAKEKGANGFEFYDASMSVSALKRLSLETTLRRALDRDEFLLYIQPQVDTRTGAIAAAEALIRWQNPEMGLILPGDFIALAEETGLILPIGEWVLRQACSCARSWQDGGSGPIPIAVNLSGLQFRDENLVAIIDRVTHEVGLDPRYLDLEITESVLMSGTTQTVDRLQELKARGAGISLDDFGTGYSALSYLKRFPINRLKIDRTFIIDVATDPGDAAIVSAIVSMAEGLGIAVVAEGVETEEQARKLKELGCWLMQGYLFWRPMPADAFARLLEERALAARGA
jgi:diguanylate cyclase (GGDEF)-like protein/PAS domain S-box-containing protein